MGIWMTATPSQRQRIDAWELRTRPVILTAALLPFIAPAIFPESRGLGFGIDFVSWLIFAIDFAVHTKIQRNYWRSGRGVFDLSIVLLTFPWYIFPPVGDTAFLSVFRAARLIRLAASFRGLVEVLRRLGMLGVGLAVTSVIAAFIVLRAEPPESGFEDFGDAMWWAMVSFTTVGYGDLYPTTQAGRLAGAMMMVMGLVSLGTVSAVLGSVYATNRADEDEAAAAAEPAAESDAGDEAAAAAQAGSDGGADVAQELQALRAEVALLRRSLEGNRQAGGEPPGAGGTPSHDD